MNIERKIVIGLISSTEYLHEIRKQINAKYFEAKAAKLIAQWCLEYYDEFSQAPGHMMEQLYFDKLKKGLVQSDVAEEIEDDILPGLSEEFADNGNDLRSLMHYSKKYFKERQLQLLRDDIDVNLSKGNVDKALALVSSFNDSTISDEFGEQLNLNTPDLLPAVETALTITYQPLIKFAGALGDFWNHSFVRGALIGLLAREKMGKTWDLMEFGLLAVEQKNNVAFFQAGDMTANQMLRRLAINRTGKTDKEKYTGQSFCTVKDCAKNQLNLCDKRIRESGFGVFEDRNWDIKTLRNEITMDDLIEAYKIFPEYQPCYNCSDYSHNSWGVPWIQPQTVKMISVVQTVKMMEDYFVKKNKNLRLCTYPNGTLTTKEIRKVLKQWKLIDNWQPDVIIIDYADLIVSTNKTEERHKQNEVWKDLRGINQETDTLMITATQADANSYESDLLKLKNYSEDKRKYSHCTAFYGLNQDRHGREKKMNLMRINELILREDEFDVNKTVTVIQNLRKGKPITGSFF